MALQSSGQISLSNIATEMGVSLSNVSLGTQSTTNVNQNSTSKPDGSQPHSISEFYGYDHNAPTEFSMVLDPYGDSGEACENGPGMPFESRWHDGVGTSPTIGDVVYADEQGNEIFVGGNAWYYDFTGNKSIYITDEGIVDNEFYC